MKKYFIICALLFLTTLSYASRLERSLNNVYGDLNVTGNANIDGDLTIGGSVIYSSGTYNQIIVDTITARTVNGIRVEDNSNNLISIFDTNKLEFVGELIKNGNTNYGSAVNTFINLGNSSIGGTSGSNFQYITISGGYQITASSTYATVGGGWLNEAKEEGAVIAGGVGNKIYGTAGTISGGDSNLVLSQNASIGGGTLNRALGNESTVSGGTSNTASGENSIVGGGESNICSGLSSIIPGGSDITVAGDYSLGAGRYMNLGAAADRTFVWGYSGTSTATITAADSFLIFPLGNTGKVGINAESPAYALDIEGDIRINGSAAINEFSIDGTLAGDSDTALPTEKAVKTYVDTQTNGAHITVSTITAETANGIRFEDNSNNLISIFDTNEIEVTGKIGVNVSNPLYSIQVDSTSSYLGVPLLIDNQAGGAASATGIRFRSVNTATDVRSKGGIFFERTGTGGVGSMHIAIEGTNDDSNVDLSDAKITLDSDGEVGINTTSPSEELDVNGTIQGSQIAISDSSPILKFLDDDDDEYSVTTGSDDLLFWNTVSGSHAHYKFFTEDGDGTNNISLAIFGLGTYDNISNAEWLETHFRYSDSEFEIATRSAGTGTTRDLEIYTQDNDNQIRLESDGTLGFGKAVANGVIDIDLATEDLSFDDAGSTGATEQDWIEVTVGGVTGYIRVYSSK